MTQKDALTILKTGANVFLTGAPGSGKTHVLREYIQYLKNNHVEVAVTASTGIAATHLHGMTIHAWTGMGIKDTLTDYDIDNLLEKQYLYKRFEKTHVLIIDEISMLSGTRLTMIEWICRSFKRNDKPFGGMQVVLCGDFFQLPPVVRGEVIEHDFAYHSDVWDASRFTICYLTEQHRQSDDMFLSVLHAIRDQEVTEEIREILYGRTKASLPHGLIPTRLFTHNADVDTINSNELETLKAPTREFTMQSKGKDILVDMLKKSCLAPERLLLKEGARVMFVKNNYELGFVNGTLGKVKGFNTFGEPVVETISGKEISVSPMSWTIEEEGKIKAEIRQLPLRLAWAITVHKSQGMSLDALEVDLSKSFVKGMGYVALSRVRTLSGMRLLGFNNLSLEVDESVCEFDKRLQEESIDATVDLHSRTPESIEKSQLQFLARIMPPPEHKPVKKKAKDMIKDMIEEGMSLSDMAEAKGVKQETVISYIEELVGEDVDISYLKKEFSYKELDTILDAFEECETTTLSPVYEYLSKKKKKTTYAKLRLARLFI